MANEKWLINNFLTGQDEQLPDNDEGPTREWVEGWEAYMHGGYHANPYELGSYEANEWQDGYDAAERD